MAMDIAEFEIQVGAHGRGQVIVNGEDVSDKVNAVSFHTGPQMVPTLILSGVATGTIQGAGIVEVRGEGNSAAVAGFIRNLDPEEVEEEALANLGQGDDPNVTAAVLSLVARLVEEQM